MFQNGTCALPLQFAALVDISEVLCDCRSFRTKEIGDLLLRQPHRLVFKAHVQPNGLVRLIDDNLVLARSHSTLPLKCRGAHASRNSAHDDEGEEKRGLGMGFHRVSYTIFAVGCVGFRGRFSWPRKVSVVRREQIRVLIKTAAPAYAEASGGQARCRGGGLTGVAFSPHGPSILPARTKRPPRTEILTSPHGPSDLPAWGKRGAAARGWVRVSAADPEGKVRK